MEFLYDMNTHVLGHHSRFASYPRHVVPRKHYHITALAVLPLIVGKSECNLKPAQQANHYVTRFSIDEVCIEIFVRILFIYDSSEGLWQLKSSVRLCPPY